jgi:hypothetical protein
MVVYLNRILCNYRIIHRPYPAGIWLALHQLYLQARQHGRHRDKVEWPGPERRRSTVEQEYKRALLLSLLEPQLFRRSQMAEVHAAMPRWLEEAVLAPAKQRCAGLAAYCIRADQDAPYTVLTEQCCEQCERAELGALLEVEALSATLDKALEQMGDGASTRLRGSTGTISRETLETLRQCWRVPQATRQERHRSDREVEAAIGMSAIYALLLRQAMKEGAHGISDQQMSSTLRPLFDESGTAAKREAASERDAVWDAIFFGTELGQNAWAMDAEEKNYQFIAARELNYTETGHCLAFDRGEIESLQVGELVGFRENDSRPLQLYMVRWLQDSGSTVTVGLMRLAPEVEPVLVLLQQGSGEERRTAFGCLLGIGEDGLPQLFIPYLPGGKTRELYLAVDGRELPVTLHQRVALSPLFEAYHFIAAESLHEPSTGEAIPLREVNSRLHRIAHSDEEPPHHTKDDFSDLWDSL